MSKVFFHSSPPLLTLPKNFEDDLPGFVNKKQFFFYFYLFYFTFYFSFSFIMLNHVNAESGLHLSGCFLSCILLIHP